MFIASFLDIDNCVKMLVKVLNVANVLHHAHTTGPFSLFDAHYPVDCAHVSSTGRPTETLQQHEDACKERQTHF